MGGGADGIEGAVGDDDEGPVGEAENQIDVCDVNGLELGLAAGNDDRAIRRDDRDPQFFPLGRILTR